MPMQYTEIFSAVAVITSTHNVCFGSIIRKLGIPLQTPVFLYKSGVYVSWTCFPDVNKTNRIHHGWSVEIGKSQPEGPTVPVGNEAPRVYHWNDGPEG